MHEPIVVAGATGPGGQRPVFDGEDALSDRDNAGWNEDRQIIKIGQFSTMRANYLIVGRNPHDCLVFHYILINTNKRGGILWPL
jgi:hypothetical protein